MEMVARGVGRGGGGGGVSTQLRPNSSDQSVSQTKTKKMMKEINSIKKIQRCVVDADFSPTAAADVFFRVIEHV